MGTLNQGEGRFLIEKKHISEITAEEFETKYVNRAMPVILQGILDSWPAYEKWNTAWFHEHLGNEEVQVAFDREWKKMCSDKENLEARVEGLETLLDGKLD